MQTNKLNNPEPKLPPKAKSSGTARSHRALSQIQGRAGIRAIIGSGLFWAWFDTLFMGVYFLGGSPNMPETATIGTFLISTVTYVITLLNHTAVMKAIMNKGVVFTTGAAGVLGSAAFVASGVTCSWGLLAIGAVL